jgi:phage gpG-like protein
MSGADVDFSEVLRELKKIERRASDFSPLTPIIAETLVGYVNDEWDSAGRGRWPGLAASTIAKRRGTSSQILKDTGRAAASVRAEYDGESASAVTDVAYMLYHVSDGARTRIPLRNPFDVLDVAMPEIDPMIARYIASGET